MAAAGRRPARRWTRRRRTARRPSCSAELRPYQQDGFGWLAFLWEHRLGGILADDMGLGKTLQALALICHARERDPAGGAVPDRRADQRGANWVAEAARFTPGLRVVPITDTLRPARRRTSASWSPGPTSSSPPTPCSGSTSTAYARLAWSGLLLDEAQFVKNRQSKIYQCARRLAAPFKLAITGTPMENNLMELWSLLSITAPGLFPEPEAFREYYAQPIETQRRRRAARPAAAPDQAAGQAPDQGAGGRRPAGQAGAGRWTSSCTRSTASSTRRACSASARRSSG